MLFCTEDGVFGETLPGALAAGAGKVAGAASMAGSQALLLEDGAVNSFDVSLMAGAFQDIVAVTDQQSLVYMSRPLATY